MKTTKIVGATCGVFAGLFAWNSLCLFQDNTFAAGTSVNVNVTVQEVISLSVDDSELSLELTPTVAGTSGSTSTNVKVSTNNLTGYKLTLATNTAESALTSTTAATKIASVSTAAALDSIANNTWGYLGSDSLYHAVPSSTQTAAVLKNTSTVANEDTSKLQFGVKVNNSMTSGDYSNTVVLTAVANQ